MIWKLELKQQGDNIGANKLVERGKVYKPRCYRGRRSYAFSFDFSLSMTHRLAVFTVAVTQWLFRIRILVSPDTPSLVLAIPKSTKLKQLHPFVSPFLPVYYANSPKNYQKRFMRRKYFARIERLYSEKEKLELFGQKSIWILVNFSVRLFISRPDTTHNLHLRWKSANKTVSII